MKNILLIALASLSFTACTDDSADESLALEPVSAELVPVEAQKILDARGGKLLKITQQNRIDSIIHVLDNQLAPTTTAELCAWLPLEGTCSLACDPTFHLEDACSTVLCPLTTGGTLIIGGGCSVQR